MLCSYGEGCYRLIVCAKDILEKNDFERGFHSTAQAGLKLMVVPLLQPVLSLHMYLQTCFSLYIFLPFKFFKIIAYRIQGKREFESQD